MATIQGIAQLKENVHACGARPTEIFPTVGQVICLGPMEHHADIKIIIGASKEFVCREREHLDKQSMVDGDVGVRLHHAV